jgi:hypothetical protein
MADPDRPSGRMLIDDDMESSYVDLADPRHLEFSYMRWLRIVFGAAAARRVLHVGGGACALARALAAEDPGGMHEVSEIDPEVVAVARDHLGLRRAPGLRVRVIDGREHLEAQADDSWDAVCIDAFLGARQPARLISVEAFATMARVAPLVGVNVVDGRAGQEVARVAAGLASAYPRVWGLNGGSSRGNTILVGERAPSEIDLRRIASAAAADSEPGRLLDPDRVSQLARSAAAVREG